jgi:hypothetical protein
MVKTNFSQNGVCRRLSEAFYLPFSRLPAAREEVVSPFCPGPFLIRETLLNLAVATLISVPVVAAGWLVQKRLEPEPNLRSCKMTFGRLLDQSVRDAGKGSPRDYWRNRSRDAEHFTRPWRRKSRMKSAVPPSLSFEGRGVGNPH